MASGELRIPYLKELFPKEPKYEEIQTNVIAKVSFVRFTTHLCPVLLNFSFVSDRVQKYRQSQRLKTLVLDSSIHD